MLLLITSYCVIRTSADDLQCRESWTKLKIWNIHNLWCDFSFFFEKCINILFLLLYNLLQCSYLFQGAAVTGLIPAGTHIIYGSNCKSLQNSCPVWASGCKNGPAPFPGRMSYKATKPGLVCVYHILACCIIVLWFIRAPFYVLLVFIAVCFVFWLFWLSCHYLPSDWLERLLWGSLAVARGSSP